MIIPTIGRPNDLRACLESLRREADTSLAQVIVVDDAATVPVTLPPDVAGAPIHLLRNAVRRGAAYCRNRALQVVAEGVDAVGFLDDDVRLCQGWLATARRELKPTRAAVTGAVRRFDQGIVSRARQLRYDRRYAPLVPGQAVDFLAGGNAVIWRDMLVGVGGFPDVPTMSDRFLVRRLEARGGCCHFVPEMLVLHRNSKGLRVAVREAWRAGLLDDTALDTPALKRLATGVREAIVGPQPAAALLNVALDGVYLSGRRRGRLHEARARSRASTTQSAKSA
ncbi:MULTISPECIES: glycosyltransferase family 2 protein [unclassified Nonomuraea]|uniref:glycosyltransferase family 2 protein n=1 Tax=unclassified Nonomuraea TaxID=2593643 RepID=UPI0013776F96|nr:glycosyltransferase [Nonomuraea sp. KC401]NBE92568.1 glycosyltransferase [Nonomuraea sp. K271]